MIQFWSDQWDYDRPTMAMVKEASRQLEIAERNWLTLSARSRDRPSSTSLWSMRAAYHILARNYWRRRAFKAERRSRPRNPTA